MVGALHVTSNGEPLSLLKSSPIKFSMCGLTLQLATSLSQLITLMSGGSGGRTKRMWSFISSWAKTTLLSIQWSSLQLWLAQDNLGPSCTTSQLPSIWTTRGMSKECLLSFRRLATSVYLAMTPCALESLLKCGDTSSSVAVLKTKILFSCGKTSLPRTTTSCLLTLVTSQIEPLNSQQAPSKAVFLNILGPSLVLTLPS